MANNCAPQVQACAIRVAKLYPNGVPAQGAQNLLVSDALVSLAFNAEQKAGDEFVITTACGANYLDYKDCDRLRRLNLTVNVATPSPYLTHFLTGAGVILQDGDAIGYGFPTLNEATCPNGVSIEIWAKRVTSTGSLDPDHQYVWWAFPKVFLQIDSATFENGPFQPSFTGFAVENENWHDGPANDWPVASGQVAQFIPTNDLPDVDCEPSVLVAS